MTRCALCGAVIDYDADRWEMVEIEQQPGGSDMVPFCGGCVDRLQSALDRGGFSTEIEADDPADRCRQNREQQGETCDGP